MKLINTIQTTMQKAYVKAMGFAAQRGGDAGVEVTGETIGWLIAAIILVALGVSFAAGGGTTWMNTMFHDITSISPTNP